MEGIRPGATRASLRDGVIPQGESHDSVCALAEFRPLNNESGSPLPPWQ
jgi:hypothetical protein